MTDDEKFIGANLPLVYIPELDCMMTKALAEQEGYEYVEPEDYD